MSNEDTDSLMSDIILPGFNSEHIPSTASACVCWGGGGVTGMHFHKPTCGYGSVEVIGANIKASSYSLNFIVV